MKIDMTKLDELIKEGERFKMTTVGDRKSVV